LIGDAEKARQVYQAGGDLGIAQISQRGTQKYLESCVSGQVKRLGGMA